jgi:hypothetical protein
VRFVRPTTRSRKLVPQLTESRSGRWRRPRRGGHWGYRPNVSQSTTSGAIDPLTAVTSPVGSTLGPFSTVGR